MPNKKSSCRACFPLLNALLLSFTFLSSDLAAGQTASTPPLTPEVVSHWPAAQDAQNRKDYATTAKEYREVIARSPRFAEAYQNLGLAYELEERWPDAMQAFLEALALKPALPGANLFLGLDYCQQGQGRRAIPYLVRAVASELIPGCETESGVQRLVGVFQPTCGPFHKAQVTIGVRHARIEADRFAILGFRLVILPQANQDDAAKVPYASVGGTLLFGLRELLESQIDLISLQCQQPLREGIRLSGGAWGRGRLARL